MENADVLDVGDVPSVCPLAVKAAEARAGTSSKKPLVTQVSTLVSDELHATSDTLSSWQLLAFFEQHFRSCTAQCRTIAVFLLILQSHFPPAAQKTHVHFPFASSNGYLHKRQIQSNIPANDEYRNERRSEQHSSRACSD